MNPKPHHNSTKMTNIPKLFTPRVLRALLFSFSLQVTLFTSCAFSQNLTAVDYQNQSIQLSLSTEPPNLNTMKATDNISAFVLEHLQEGLLRIDARHQLTGAIAEHWELTESSATFHLRKEAMWSDGLPITAHDFVFAWRKVVDPATASQYASILFSIRNAEAINNGQANVETLGVHATDDHTLVVELEQPTGYFLQLMPFITFYPVREDFFNTQNTRFAADADKMLFSGPFILSEWVHGASLRLQKNPNYWNHDNVHLNVINIPYITPDTNAVFNLFRDDKLALMTGLDAQSLQSALDNRMRIRNTSTGGLVYQALNHREDRLTANLNFRKALQAAYDNQELVYKVLGIPGNIPGVSLFPTYLQGAEDKFRVEYPVEQAIRDREKAPEYLALAREELGLDTFPSLTLLTDSDPTTQTIAQYLQGQYKQVLGLDIKIDAQAFKQRLAKMQAGDFDITLAAWYPDYEDPMTFADLFASWNVNNRGKFSNADLDDQVRLAQNSTDPETRMNAMAEVQRIIGERVAILPDYEKVQNYVQHPQLEGVQFKVTGGSPILIYARVLPPSP